MKNSIENIEVEFDEIKFNLISQPYHSKQCGQSCLAMITGKSLNQICKDLGKYWETHIVDDLQKYLDKNGFSTKLVNAIGMKFEDIPDNSLVSFKYQNGTTHSVVKYRNEYYDPDIGVVKYYDDKVMLFSYIKFKRELIKQE